MKPGARAQAAIDVLDEIARTGRPTDATLRAWGRAHRFAGSRDRAAIAALVFAVFRARARLALRMGDANARALVLAALLESGQSAEAIAADWDGAGHNPSPLTPAERAALERPLPEPLPAWVEANCPEWVYPLLQVPEAERLAAFRALNTRAPLDLRVNTLRTAPEKALRALRKAVEGRENPPHFEPAPFSPLGLRVTDGAGGPPALDLQGLKPFADGRVDVQDEGSQIAALMVGARPGEQVVDLCAGAGGKTLALAAQMENKGQIFACDPDPGRLEEARTRIQRAGVRNAQTHHLPPNWLEGTGLPPALADLAGKVDRVLLDVPCSGSGAWRRSPDARWRLTPEWLDALAARQLTLLERAAELVRPGGEVHYVTCSIFGCENSNIISKFREKSDKLVEVNLPALWPERVGGAVPDGAVGAGAPGVGPDGLGTRSLRLSPARTQTDGFFMACLRGSA